MDDPIEDQDEDLYDIQPPPGPSPREVRRHWVEEGNVEAFLDLIRKTPWSSISIGEQLQNLMAACRAGAKADPEGFSRSVFAELVGLNAFLALRTGVYVAERVVGCGPMPCTPTLADFSPDVIERILPRLLEMQRAMAEVLHAQAATARMWALARAKDAKAGRAVAADHRSDRRSRPQDGKATSPRRKAAGAGGARDVVVPLPTRSRRRG